MDRQEAVQVLGLENGNNLTQAQLRKHYLRCALITHPDKNSGDEESSQKFARVQRAYNLLLEEISLDAALVDEKIRTEELFNLLMRAMKGEDVESELRNLGVPRPSAMFGIDLGIPFERHHPKMPARRNSDGVYEHLNMREAFREAFEDEGLDEEGSPLAGWARPPVADMDDL